MQRVIWLTGNSGAGKTTTAQALRKRYPYIIILDGDEMRETISKDEGFSPEDRLKHNLRVARLAQLLSSQGHTVVVSVIAPFNGLREQVSAICDPLWVYIKRDNLDTPERPYEPMNRPDMIIHIPANTPEEAAGLVSLFIHER